MRVIITAILLILILNVQGRSYYVNAVTGNDANSGLSTVLAWKTLAKVNSFTFVAGDSIRFNRGDVFYGSLIPRVGLIVIDNYGTGVNPLISGFTNITTLQSSGNGIYSAVVSNIDTITFNLLSINGQPYAKGRFPDANASNGGYLRYSNGDTTKLWGVSAGTIRLNDEVVFKSNFWTLAKGRVWKVSADTVWYRKIFDLGNGVATGYSNVTANYGYFFQDDSTYLNRFGEWHLDRPTKRLRIYLGGNPAGISIRASTVDTLLNLSNKVGIVINNIDFEGGNLYGIYGASFTGITINSCKINQIGGDGIGFNRVSNVTITNSTIKNTLGIGIYSQNPPGNNFTITNSFVDSIGMLPGMGSFNQGADYSSMTVAVNSGLTIKYNSFSNAGLDVRWQGSNVNIIANKCRAFTALLADHAGSFYTYDANGSTVYTNRIIDSNFVSEAIGNVFGTSDTTREEVAGIYLDGTTNNVKVRYNTIWRIPGNGIQMNAPTNVEVRGNTILLDSTLNEGKAKFKSIGINYNSNSGAGTIPNGDTISNLSIKKNIVYIFKNTQNIQYSVNRITNGVPLANSIKSFGSMDSNYYNKATVQVHRIFSSPTTYLYNLTQWRAFSGYDVNTVILRDVIQDSTLLVTNWSGRDSIFVFPGKKYIDAYGNVFNNSITLSRYTGRLLFYNGTSGSLTVNISKTDISCFGTNTGSATATPVGGTAPFTYTWTPGGQTTSSVSSLSPGSYTVTVRDVNLNIASASTVITQPSAALTVSATFGIISSIGGTTSVVVTATGGTAPYAGTGTFNNVGVGTYTYTVTDSKGCVASKTITIGYTANSPLAGTVTSTNVTCFGGANGSATMSASGGISPLSFLWTGGAVTSSISGNVSGSYTVTVTDGVGSTITAVATITQPTQLVATSVATGIITSVGGTTSVIVSASGGVPPYTGTATFASQGIGSHTYTVTDANGCSTTTTIVLAYTNSGVLSAAMSKTDVSCFGGSNGSATVTPSGGITPYSVKWLPGGEVTSSIISKTAGTYTATITDGVGATVSNSISITQPTKLIAEAVATGPITALDGTTSVIVSASGGTPPYSGATTYINQAVGTHIYTVTDTNGCSVSDTLVLTYTSVDTLTTTLSATNATCFGGTGSVTSTTTGGIPPYVFNWSNFANTQNISGVVANTYTLTVTDGVGTVISKSISVLQPPKIVISHTYGTISTVGGTTSVLISATGGTGAFTGTGSFTQGVGTTIYTVTDGSGCIAKDTITLSYTPLGTLSTVLIASKALCYGGSTGSIVSSTSGGVLPYGFSWSNGANTQNISGITANTYTLTVTDGVGATTSRQITVLQPPPLVATATYGTISTVGGTTSVVVTAFGGTPGYMGDGIFAGQTVGPHTYTVIDVNGCSTNVTVNIPFTPPPLVIDLSKTDVLCFGGTGSASASVSGGVPPYDYSWSNGSDSSDLTAGSGTYILTVTDSLNAVGYDTITISQPEKLVASYVADTVTVLGGTADVIVSASGGTPVYDGIGTYNTTNGLHLFTIEDSNGCTASITAVVWSTAPTVVTVPVNTVSKSNVVKVKFVNQ